ncbi:MAG TPA: MFS transporter [Kofleriaceae bacterium]
MDKVRQELLPIVILCGVIALVVSQLPRVQLGHSAAFRRRRVLNWLPLGLTYAFLYMGRYNLNGLLDAKLLSGTDFANIDAIGSITYGLAFLVNGPICDKLGGRTTILIAAAGSAACNAAMGLLYFSTGTPPSVGVLTLLFAANMYFQSFGAVSIVKVNANWFHLRERGTFGGIFGILISLGIYLAFDWAPKIASLTSPEWLFLAPACFITLFLVLSYLFVRDTPGDAGHVDFDVEDASSGDTGPPETPARVVWRLLTTRIILIIALISLCAGFLRQGILKWYRTFASGLDLKEAYVYKHWGMVACIAGIIGGMFAGVISDHVFQSRRPPVSTVLFAFVLAGAIALIPLFAVPATVSWVVAFMMMSAIGVNGMLSGVASQDYGGRKHAGTATGLIDGFVYFGTALQDQVFGRTLPEKGSEAAKHVDNWYAWPIAMIPIAVIGLGLSIWVWNVRATPRSVKR